MKRILMIGSGPQVKGGISALVQNYIRSGLFGKHRILYIESHVDGSKARKAFKFVQAALRFLYHLVSSPVEIVHVHSASRASFFRKSFFVWCAKAFRRKTIFQLHGGEFGIFFHKECGWLRKSFVRATLSSADVILCLSTHWSQVISQITLQKAKIAILPNCVEAPTRQKRHTEADEIVALFMGKLESAKGVFTLIEAADQLKRSGRNIRFILCGEGEQAVMEKAAAEKNVSDRVEFPGWINDKSSYYCRGDIFVLPSYNECLPMALIEAASYGLPLVSTRVGGIPEIVIDELNGFLVDPGDADSLKEKIAALADSVKLRREMGRKGIELVNIRFSASTVTENLSRIYERLA